MSTGDPSLDTAREKIAALVERFRANRDAHKSQTYNETLTRRDFIDPFFEALGWDMDNRKGYAPAYREVIHEDAIKIGGFTKAPDYCFRIGGERKFFVEAKKPFVDMKNASEPYYQLRRYAYSAKLPLSIVTDFEELAIVDCRAKPSLKDKASTGRIRYWRCEEYADHLEELLESFSPDGIKKGGLDRLAVSAKAKRGTGEVDKEFLKEIETWRELLARNIARRNPGLSQRELNTAVQLTIDRIIFLRICEDRGIEEYGLLQGLQNGTNVYARLSESFQRADERYNSGLFHFKQERGNASHPDTLTLDLAIGDKPLKQILKGLYYPDSPYEFSVLPIDILGQVYEQFLGKVIRLTAGHQAVIEDKPEVKKAGGVYYTPTYIVDYIVENTVGKLLGCQMETPCHPERSEESALSKQSEGSRQKPKPVTPTEAANLRILDPACGSGSFLIGAYEFLLNWHRDWYSENDPEKWAKGKQPRLFAGKNGWQLTTAEKKRILLNNIYGVDIDPQAVEVTKLSLLLKVLEEESQETINAQLNIFRERALPDLSNNIKCGNSLIGTDFYEGQQLGMLEGEELQRINPFNWEDEFAEIMKGGGFDAVIGNPPYVRIQALKEWAPVEVEIYKKNYAVAAKGNYDIYVVFVERGLSLLNEKGVFGFILPHKFFNAKMGIALRTLLSKGRNISKVVHFGAQQVFAQASTYTCLLFLRKSPQKELALIKVGDLDEWRNSSKAEEGKIESDELTDSEWHFSIGDASLLLKKLDKVPVKLEDVTERIFQGLKTSADKVYIVEELEREKNRVRIYSREKQCEYWLEPDLLHPLIKGGDSKRYRLTRTKRLILFPYAVPKNEKVDLIDETEMQGLYPLTWSYLNENKEFLASREKNKMRGSRWYGYIYPKALDVMSLPKIFTPDIAAHSSLSLDETGEVFFTGGVAGGYGILVKPDISREYILGVLNSKLIEWFIHQTATQMRGGWYSYESRFIRNLPIVIDFSNPADKSRHDQTVELVERMLQLNKQLQSAKTSHDKTTLQRQIDATDRQIDRLVYELYDLSDEEIKIVEDAR